MGALLAVTVHPTFPDVLTFAISGAIVVSGAFGVVWSRNPVHAALSLVATLFGIAVLFIEENANFLAAVQIIVYAGAVVVLFLFVIMFLGVDRQERIEVEPLHGQRWLAALAVFAAMGGVVALLGSSHWTVTGAHRVTAPINGPHGEVGQLGTQLFTHYLFAFEATAGLLVIAVVGAVVLARRPSGPELDERPGAASGAGAGPDDGDDLADRAPGTGGDPDGLSEGAAAAPEFTVEAGR